jgi:NAD(P)-dependent dehydrogenase (short-subunit alcohol dehydrogenase family)
MNMKYKAVFIAISSDIAYHIASHLLSQSWEVHGTFRNKSDSTLSLESQGAILYELDVSSNSSVISFLGNLSQLENWDLLMISPSVFGKVGLFCDVPWGKWLETFSLNSTQQFEILHALLPLRKKQSQPLCWLWSGPGTNSAPADTSALILAKICQIKFAEILNEEYLDLRPIVVGPGWVMTKTHQQIIDQGPSIGYKYFQTIKKIESGQMTDYKTIISFFDWAIEQPKEVIGGRNFSIRSDIWGDPLLNEALVSDPNAFKLRRYKNDWRPENQDQTSFIPH